MNARDRLDDRQARAALLGAAYQQAQQERQSKERALMASQNPEQTKLEASARRRALNNLTAIIGEAQKLQRKLGDGQGEPDADDVQTLAENVRDLTGHLGVLDALRQAREWEAADRAVAGRQGLNVHIMRLADELGMRTDLNLPPVERPAELGHRVVDEIETGKN